MADEQVNRNHRNRPCIGDRLRSIQGFNLLRDEVLRYGDFAQDCYNFFDSNPPRTHSDLPRPVTSSSTAETRRLIGYDVTRYIYANTSLCRPRDGDRGAWMGYIAIFTDEEEIKRSGGRDIVVAWRGTKTFQEWMQNLKDILALAPLANCAHLIETSDSQEAPVRIENGFLSIYTSGCTSCHTNSVQSARDIVLGEITELLNKYTDVGSITFTGHSLGAALATISAYDIKQIAVMRRNPRILVRVFAFASPRVGNLAFSNHLKEIGVEVLRLVNKWDIIPKCPGMFFHERMGCLTKCMQWFPWAYIHVGEVITFDSCNSPHLVNRRWFSCHDLRIYLGLIARLSLNPASGESSSGGEQTLHSGDNDSYSYSGNQEPNSNSEIRPNA